jgi:uncharacterized protein (UPF0332 family)
MFDWAEYFELAKELAQRQDEASQRSAISRAYYAAFCSARNRLRGQIVIPQTSEAHSMVWNQFQESPAREQRQIGQLGRRLRHARTEADYDDSVPELPKVVENAIATAGKLLSILRGL